jgi:hypothetical protein
VQQLMSAMGHKRTSRAANPNWVRESRSLVTLRFSLPLRLIGIYGHFTCDDEPRAVSVDAAACFLPGTAAGLIPPKGLREGPLFTCGSPYKPTMTSCSGAQLPSTLVVADTGRAAHTAHSRGSFALIPLRWPHFFHSCSAGLDRVPRDRQSLAINRGVPNERGARCAA